MRRRRKSTCAGATVWPRSSITRSSANISTASIEHFRRAIEIDPQFALAYSALGSSYVNRVLKGLGQAGDHEKAKNAFKKALALDPKLLEARRHMIFIYLTGGQKQKAREAIESLRREYPNDSGVQFVRGVVARLDGEYDIALRSFDRMADFES